MIYKLYTKAKEYSYEEKTKLPIIEEITDEEFLGFNDVIQTYHGEFKIIRNYNNKEISLIINDIIPLYRKR